jgi:hypothetical protein
LAVCLGGRWQRSPGVIFAFGEYILKYDIMDIDSVLAFNDVADTAAGDLVYPVGACLAEYLYNTLGEDRFFELYRALSGKRREVQDFTVDDVRTTIMKAAGQSWEEFGTAFRSFVDSQAPYRGLIYPGTVEAKRILIDQEGVAISCSDKWIQVSYQPNDSGMTEVSVLFDEVPEMHGKSSVLFAEQFKGIRDYTGFRFGLKMDKNEIGLYDYATNQIVAKYIDNIESGSGYFAPESNKITAYFDISLLQGGLPDKDKTAIIVRAR